MFIIFILVMIIEVSRFYNFLKIHFIFTYLYGCMSVCVPMEREGIGCPGAGITGRCELPDAGTGNRLGFSSRALSVFIS